jgi:hypothetical protein
MKKILILLTGALLLMGVIVYQTVFNSVTTINRSKTEWRWVESDPSTLAHDFFWEQFHLENYDTIPKVIELLSAPYIANPKDLQTVYHLGFAHIWALSERQHLQNIPGTIIDHAVLAQKYLGEAYLMNPNDGRVLSFLAASKIIVGTVSEKDMLENRIGHARENVALFRKEVSTGEKLATTQTILSQTAISCRACHQISKRSWEISISILPGKPS